MRLLLDTHVFLWWLVGDDSFSAVARAAIEGEGNAVFVSAASAWEIATKHRVGKLPNVAAIVGDLERAAVDQGFVGLPISLLHAQVAGGLPGPHRDPFDRMLIAQAMVEKLVLVSNEAVFDAYGVARVWEIGR